MSALWQTQYGIYYKQEVDKTEENFWIVINYD